MCQLFAAADAGVFCGTICGTCGGDVAAGDVDTGCAVLVTANPRAFTSACCGDVTAVDVDDEIRPSCRRTAAANACSIIAAGRSDRTAVDYRNGA